MSIELVKNLLKRQENIRLEFKEARDSIPRNLFETVCAFLNREGGSVLLGVDDDGKVVGVNPIKIDQISKDISSLSNNHSKLNPPYLLFPSVADIRSKKVIHLQVPASSQVHKCDNIVFDRSSDGDFRVTSPEGIAEIYNRKRAHFTEGKIYPFVKQADFKEGLLAKVRYLIKDNKPNHPWLGLSDDEFFRTSGLFKRDLQNGTEGFTLAAALLLGKDDVICDILPHYKIDALVKIKDVDRYDDRLTINTNLIEAYNQLMEFVSKHLPDKFFLEGDMRISLREKIFREVIANLIVHREYTNAHSATFTIYKDRVELLNANNPNGSGPISLSNFLPFPKNPIISKLFVQIGRVEELGSGIINVTKYLRNYSPGSKPEFIEDSVFKTVIPVKVAVAVADNVTITDVVTVEIDDALNGAISEALNEGINEGISEGIKERLVLMTKFLFQKEKLKTSDFLEEFKLSPRTIKGNLNTLKLLSLIVYTGSPKSGYYEISREFLKKLKGKAK